MHRSISKPIACLVFSLTLGAASLAAASVLAPSAHAETYPTGYRHASTTPVDGGPSGAEPTLLDQLYQLLLSAF